MDTATFKEGDTVKVKPGVTHPYPRGPLHAGTSKIRSVLTEPAGGVMLEKHLHGFRYWNVAELEHVT